MAVPRQKASFSGLTGASGDDSARSAAAGADVDAMTFRSRSRARSERFDFDCAGRVEEAKLRCPRIQRAARCIDPAGAEFVSLAHSTQEVNLLRRRGPNMRQVASMATAQRRMVSGVGYGAFDLADPYGLNAGE
jgi:hypothetical protein